MTTPTTTLSMLQMSPRPCTASCRSPWYHIETGSHFNVVVKIKVSFNSLRFPALVAAVKVSDLLRHSAGIVGSRHA